MRCLDLEGVDAVGEHRGDFKSTAVFVENVHEREANGKRAASRRPDECHNYIAVPFLFTDRKSTRLNSSHVRISYAVFCLKKKKKIANRERINESTHDTCLSSVSAM